MTLDVSNCLKSGWSKICIATVGTPPMAVIRSSSMTFKARPASKWCIITIFMPAAVLVVMTAKHPVA